MYVVTRTRKIAEENDDGELVARTELQGVTVEEDVDKLLQQSAMADYRLAGVRVFELVVDDSGHPVIGEELTA